MGDPAAKVPEGIDPVEHGEEWEHEIDRRIEEVRSGKVKLVPYDEVVAKLRAKHGWD